MRKRWRIGGVVLAAIVALSVAALLWPSGSGSAAAADTVAPGSLNVVVKPGEKLVSCPLEHTSVEGWITGEVARVQVTQRFTNPTDHPIEAVYVFPLPENAAVNDMVMKIGQRTVRGVIKKREEAKADYEAAKQAGKTASLLEQERPNIFTQSVANIMPGDPIEITIWYVQDLKYERGRYQFVFPMVVGPRYIPGTPTGAPPAGGGWAPDTTEVPDASRITPPVLKPEERTGHDISLTLHLEAGVPAHDVRSISHQIVLGAETERPRTVTLAPHDTIPNKDFVLTWQVAGEKPEVGVITHRDARSGYFTLLLQPKANVTAREVTPKEMVFCLDTSGSMSGLPIEKSKEVVKRCLREMGPRDTFQVIRFAGDSSTFAPAPVPATPQNVERAIAYVEQLQGAGGTEMLRGIEASLAFPADPEKVRIVAFLTDGYIGNETQILDRIQGKLGAARIFSFGIGSSVNRYLLVKMAQIGRGDAQFVRWDQDPEEAVQTFVSRIARPYLTDITIDWAGLDAQDTYPSYVPDLFADQPLILHGRYDRPGSGVIAIRGSIAGRPWQTKVSVVFPASRPENEVLATLWARARVEDLMDRMFGGERPDVVAQVTELALAYRLMSPYTSFVAVEEKVVNEGGKQVTVQVPVPMPEAVSYEGVFGEYEVAGRPGSAGPPASTPAMSVASPRYAGGGRAGGGGARAGGAGLTGGRAGGRVSMQRSMAAADELSGAWLLLLSTGRAGDQHAAENLRRAAGAVIGLPAGGAAVGGLDQLPRLGEQAKSVRVLVLSGRGTLSLDTEQGEGLKAFLARGGFVIVDGANDAFRRSTAQALQDLLPEAKLVGLTAGNAIFQGASMPFRVEGGAGRSLVVRSRLAVFISDDPLVEGWSRNTERTLQLGTNLIAYALQTAQ